MGSRAAKVIKEMIEKKDKELATETVNPFTKWSRTHNRNFNLKDVRKFGSR